jgi:hypothetical protein
MPTNAVPPDPRPLNFHQVLVRRWLVELREPDGRAIYYAKVLATGPEAAVDIALGEIGRHIYQWDHKEVWVALDEPGEPAG